MHNCKRVDLTVLTPSDKEFFTSLYTSEQIMKHICAPFTQSQARVFFSDVLRAMQPQRGSKKYMYFVIHSKADELPVGIVGLNWNKHVADTAEIGTLIKPQFQRSGFGITASLLLINYAFKKLALKRIDALCDPANEGTLRTMKKLGFKRLKAKQNKQGVLCEYWCIKAVDVSTP